MAVGKLAIVAAALVVPLASACFQSQDASCRVTCNKSSACPGSLSCIDGYCVAEGASCTATSVDAAVGDATNADGSGIDAAAPLGPVRSIAGRHTHVCAATWDGRVLCWGDNRYGQLGDMSTTSSSTPRTVVTGAGLPLTDAKAVVAGEGFSCALHVSGAISCWGRNNRGQLGVSGGNRPYAAPAGPVENVESLAARGEHACALRSTGEVWCWGRNEAGELGDETYSPRYWPAPVQNLPDDASFVGDGRYHNCLVVSGSALCTGWNATGQLGAASPEATSNTLQVVVDSESFPLEDVVTVSGSVNHTCATDLAGDVYCWGENESGKWELGFATSGVFNHATVPVGLVGGCEALEVSAGSSHNCVRCADGRVSCWGSGGDGRLGNGGTAASEVPVFVDGIATAIDLTVMASAACALLAGGEVVCWGANDEGQLGDGNLIDADAFSSTPISVVGLPPPEES